MLECCFVRFLPEFKQNACIIAVKIIAVIVLVSSCIDFVNAPHLYSD